MQKLLALFCVLASLLPAAPALAAMPDAEFLKICEQGSPAAVAQALKDGANPNAADKDGETALLKAAYYSQAGAAVNAADTQGKTALMYAASGGNTQVVRLLLEAGADVNFANLATESRVPSPLTAIIGLILTKLPISAATLEIRPPRMR